MASIKSREFGQKEPALLLGASGRLGQMMGHYWPQPHDLVRQSRAGGAGLLRFDLLQEPAQTVAAMAGKRAVFCLSGVTPAYGAQHGTPMSLNVDLALAALRAGATADVGRLFLASTAAVYGAGGGPFRESDPLAPLSEYGRAKMQMERQSQALATQLAVPLTILRIGNVAGADAILGNWQPGMQIDHLADGTTPRRSYIGPQTLARVMFELSLQQDLPAVLNIAAPGTVAMGDLLDAADLPWHPRPAPDQVIPSVAFDTSQLEQYINFTPQDSNPAQMVAQWNAMREPT